MIVTSANLYTCQCTQEESLESSALSSRCAAQFAFEIIIIKCLLYLSVKNLAHDLIIAGQEQKAQDAVSECVYFRMRRTDTEKAHVGPHYPICSV